MDKKFWQAIAIMTGCIIGGGVLALPYAVAQSGFWSSMLLIISLGLIMLFINLRIGEMSIAVKKQHQVVGLVEKFLGKKGKNIMTTAMLLLSYGALIAYAIGSARILSLLGGGELMWRVIFYIICSIMVGKGIQAIGGSELILETIKIGIVAIIVALGMGDGINTTFFAGFSPIGIGMVFGVALFAYLGLVSVPAVYELVKQKQKLRKIIIIGSIIPIIVYVLFITTVISKTGTATTEVATIGLQNYFSPTVGVLINIFALLALATSFLAVAYSVYDMFIRDFRIKKKKSFILAFLPSFIGMLFLESFARTIDLAGAIAGSTMAILLILAHRKAKEKYSTLKKVPLPLDIIIICVFVTGAIFAFA